MTSPTGTPSLILTPRKAAIGTAGGALDVLVEATAPALAEDDKKMPRQPLNLAFVIDRSGSMDGQPIAEAKRCVARMIAAMRPEDRAAVVVYDDTVDVVVPSDTVERIRATLEQDLARVDARGMTALHAGWLAGAEQAAAHTAPSVLSRVILLSDGQANQGLVDPAEIAAQCVRLADSGVGTSTYGLGRMFNEDLMTKMAEAGGGSAYYGESVEDLMPQFEAEFDALSATFGRRPSLKVEAGAASVSVLNGFRAAADGGSLLPNLVHGAAVWAVVRVQLPTARRRTKHKVTARIAYEDASGARRTLSATLAIPVVAETEAAALPEESRVAERVKEIEAARIQAEAKAAAMRGDWKAADGAVTTLRAMAGDNAYLLGIAGTLRELASQRDQALFSKEAAYASASLTRRYAAADESAFVLDVSGPSFARRRTRQGKAGESRP